MIEVEIWSDFACPFCYIGKKYFEKSLESYPQKESVKVTFRSFELDPSAKKSQSENIYEVLAKKYGRSVEWAQEANARVVQMAQDIGLTFNMEKIIPTNSFDAHRLFQWAAQQGKQNEAQDLLFAAYFTHGKDLASPEVLKDIVKQLGLSESDAEMMLKSDQYSSEVRADEGEAQDIGVQGVPFFLFNGKLAVSGAQPPEVFHQAFAEATKP